MKRSFTAYGFALESGTSLPDMTLAFATYAPGVMDKLTAAGVDAKYFEIDTDFGHSASGADWAKWAPALRGFLTTLEQ